MCIARNIYLDFSNLNASSSSDRYRENIFEYGQVGGRCKFNSAEFKKQGDHKSPLQSW
jgi:protein O-GlcNAc transferase